MNKGLTESQVLNQCMRYLCGCGLYVWRNNTGALKTENGFVRFGKKGSSDIIGITNDGRFLAIECKREKGGVLSDAQAEFLAEINARHGIGFSVHSVEELQKKLKENNVFLFRR